MYSSATVALLQLLSGRYYTSAVTVAARLGLPDLLEERGPQDIEALAATCAADPAALGRLLRALAALGLVIELDDGRFGATAVMSELCEGRAGSLRSLALLGGQAAFRDAWAALEHSVRTGQTAFEAVHGMSLFDYLDANPDLARLFHESSRGPELWNKVIVETYDFSIHRCLVDVGGGDGALARAVLEACPDLRAISLDRPAVIEAALPKEGAEAGRLTLQPGDFFDRVPDGDVYILRFILHDWPDADARRILTACRRSMEPTDTLLVIENVLEEGSNHPAALLDLSMLVLTGGRERTEPEFRALLEATGFTLRERRPTPAGLAILIVEPRAT